MNRGSVYESLGPEAKTEGRGWEILGDLGWVDEEGYLYIDDRRTDMIVSGGGNIYPAEAEAALSTHPNALSSVVIGLPRDDLGQRVHGLVDVGPREQDVLTTEEPRGNLELLIAPNKIPSTFESVHEPLRDDAGKAKHGALWQERVAP